MGIGRLQHLHHPNDYIMELIQQQPSHSPHIKHNRRQAMELLQNGATMRRNDMPEDQYVKLSGGRLRIYKPGFIEVGVLDRRDPPLTHWTDITNE